MKKMKKLLLTLFTAICFVNVQAQCTSNPYLVPGSGGGGTVYLTDSSTITPGWSTNYSVSYLWDFRDGTTSTQQSPCHTYGDFSNVTFSGGAVYPTLTVTYFDSTTFTFCQAIDSVPLIFFINPCVYGDVQISASGNNLTANQFYGSNITVCSNV